MSNEQIKILPKSSVSIAKFIKANDFENTYFTHPETIKAMRNSIFTSNDLVQSSTLQCFHCQQLLHMSIWHYCPFCGEK